MPSLENISAVLKTSPVASLILYPDVPRFTIAGANDVFLKSTSTTLQDIVGKGIFEVFSEGNDEFSSKGKKVLKGSLEQVLILKKAHKELLQRYDIVKDNSNEFDARFWNADTYPILDEYGQVEFIIHSPTDVTELIAQDNLENTGKETLIHKNFHHPLFNDYPDGVATLDLYGNFLSVNRIFSDLTEATEEELLRISFIPFIAPEDFQKVFDIFQKAIRGEIQNFETKIITAKGNQKTISITNLPIIDNKEVIGIYLIAKDITAMEEAKRQLNENSKRISTILESITDGFLAVDKNWIITYFNKEAELMLHVKRAMIVGKNLWEVFPNAIQEKFYPEYHRAMSDQVSVRFNEYLTAENIWLEVSAYPSGDGLAAYFRDTTEKVKAEKALLRSEQRFKALVQDGSDLIAIINRTGHYIYVSPTYQRILGIEPVHLLGEYVFDNVYEADRERMMDQFSGLKPGQSLKMYPFRMFDGQQELRWIETIITDLTDDPAVAGILVNSRDVSQRVQNEKKIRKSLDHYNAISKATADAIYDWDIINNELKWSHVLREVFGHEQSGPYLSEPWFELIHPDDREQVVNALCEQIKANKVKWKMEYRFRAADRTYRSVLDRGFFIYSPAGEPERMVGALKDISERVNYISGVEGGNRRLGEISWMQSHVVRAPLARIMGLSELLRYNEGEITQKELLSHLTDSANELDEIIRNILQQTKDI